jgi:hypothetical protein
MITLVWKELRENLKWALIALVVLGIAETYAMYPRDSNEELSGSLTVGLTLCKTSFLVVTTFGCAAVGFLLGLIQILPELRRDRWASLLHRPVPRGVLFRGKAVTGLLLYGIATVPPFLHAVWLAATPGNFNAPFVPEMVFPGTVDTCMGAAYYFAGLATGLIRGWFVLRAIPLLAAIHTSFFVLVADFFSVSVEAAVLAALMLFTAGWALMLHPIRSRNGRGSERSRFSPCCSTARVDSPIWAGDFSTLSCPLLMAISSVMNSSMACRCT